MPDILERSHRFEAGDVAFFDDRAFSITYPCPWYRERNPGSAPREVSRDQIGAYFFYDFPQELDEVRLQPSDGSSSRRREGLPINALAS